MKKILLLQLAPIVLIIVILAFISKKDQQINLNPSDQSFALIELFTSEGCSSCPPADEVVAEIQKEYADKNVLVLGYHVDYWDRLGWKDPFSSHEFTERQSYYARLFNLESIYTPQVVVNGEKEFVGSDKSKLINTVDEALKEETVSSINLKANQNASGKIKVAYSIKESISKHEQLVLLLVQKMATNKIMHGENEGRILHHINIVRDFSVLSVTSNEEIKTFSIPAGLKNEDVFVAAFIQNKKTGKIISVQSSQIN